MERRKKPFLGRGPRTRGWSFTSTFSARSKWGRYVRSRLDNMERLPHAKDLVCVYFCAARPGCRRSNGSDAVSSARGKGAVCDHAHSWWLRDRLSSRTVGRLSTKWLLWVSSICLWLSPLRLRLRVSPVRLLRSPVLVARRSARLRLRGERNPATTLTALRGRIGREKGPESRPVACTAQGITPSPVSGSRRCSSRPSYGVPGASQETCDRSRSAFYRSRLGASGPHRSGVSSPWGLRRPGRLSGCWSCHPLIRGCLAPHVQRGPAQGDEPGRGAARG